MDLSDEKAILAAKISKIVNTIFIASFPLLIGIGLLCNWQTAKIGGDVSKGKIDNGIYYIMSKNHSYIEVSQLDWIINWLLYSLTGLLGVIAGLGIVYFIYRYIIHPTLMRKDSPFH